MTKQYRNFNEIVEDNVIIKDECNDLNEKDEFYWETYHNTIRENLDTDKLIKEYVSDKKDKENLFNKLMENENNECDDIINELQESHIDSLMDCTYQLYTVDLIGDYNEFHGKMNIFYNETIESYVMPVYCFGISWKMVAPY